MVQYMICTINNTTVLEEYGNSLENGLFCGDKDDKKQLSVIHE